MSEVEPLVEVPLALNCCLSPTSSLGDSGVTAMDETFGAEPVGVGDSVWPAQLIPPEIRATIAKAPIASISPVLFFSILSSFYSS